MRDPDLNELRRAARATTPTSHSTTTTTRGSGCNRGCLLICVFVVSIYFWYGTRGTGFLHRSAVVTRLTLVPSSGQTRWLTETVQARSGPSLDRPVVFPVHRREKVKAVERNSAGWALVVCHWGRTGWVERKYLSDHRPRR